MSMPTPQASRRNAERTMGSSAPRGWRRAVYLVRAIVRLMMVMLTTAWMALVFFARAITGTATPSFVKRYKRRWGRRIMRSTGFEVVYEGDVPAEGHLLIANHRSYTDIPIVMAAAPSTFLAKASVASWPVIGWAARVGGTVFVDRSSKESRTQARAVLAGKLSEGDAVMVFAEGTTTPKGECLPLRPGMFHQAAAQGLPIVPAAIEYADEGDAWVGNDSFVSHFLRQFGRPSAKVKVSFGPMLRGNDGEVLLSKTEAFITDRLAVANGRTSSRSNVAKVLPTQKAA